MDGGGGGRSYRGCGNLPRVAPVSKACSSFPSWIGPRPRCAAAGAVRPRRVALRGPRSCTRDLRSCSRALTKWPPLGTWAPRTLPQASGLDWSSEVPRGKMTAPWVTSAILPASQTTECWLGQAEWPTEGLMGQSSWMRAAKCLEALSELLWICICARCKIGSMTKGLLYLDII